MPSSTSPVPVARVLNWLPVGGVEKRLIAILSRLDPSRFRPYIVLLRERGALADLAEQKGLPVFLCPLRTRLSPTGIARLRALFRREKTRIVHSHMYRSNTPATIAARLAGTPVVFSQVHNLDTWETRRQRFLDRALMRWRDGVIAVSGRVKADIESQLRIPPDFIHVLYNGIDLDEFRFATDPLWPARRAGERAREGFDPADLIVICVARLVEVKNLPTLIEAFARIAPSHPLARLWLIGGGPLHDTLEKQVRERSLESIVRIAGQRMDIPRLMALADISALVSHKEGFSNVVIESLAAGLPLVVTDVGGNAEAVRHETEGLVINRPDNIEAIAGALDRLLGDAALRAKMSEAARRRAQDFSLETMTRQTEELYTSALRRKGVSIPDSEFTA